MMILIWVILGFGIYYLLKDNKEIERSRRPRKDPVEVLKQRYVNGEIDDETDKAEQFVREIGEHTYIVLGTMTLNEFNDYFDVDLESDDVDTIAGYYLTGVGNIPDQDSRETFEVDTKEKHLALTNDKVKDGRVTKLKVIFSDIEQSIEED